MKAQASEATYSIPAPFMPMTWDEYLLYCQDRPAEIADGCLVPWVPQVRRGTLVIHRLYDSLHDHARGAGIGRAWISATYADLARENDQVIASLEPNVSFIARRRLKEHLAQYGEDRPLPLPPDMAAEVISPFDTYSGIMKKVKTYLQYRTQLVWVIDPQSRLIYSHSPDDPAGTVLGENDTLSGDPVLPGWSISIRTLLDG